MGTLQFGEKLKNLREKNLGRNKKQKGVFFTLAVILLIIPLLLLLSFYLNLSKTKVTEETEKMRCEELHYWVEDVKRDLQRAVVIFGRRAAIYSLGEVVDQGVGLGNYTFNCTSQCGVNCAQFSYEDKGAEAALAELVLCGTFKGEAVAYMENHTLNEWIKKIGEEGSKMHYSTNLTLTNLKITPKDAWNFAILMNLEIKVNDEGQLCFYQETPTSVMSITSIVGLEDPLYPLNTNSQVIKYIHNCSIEINLTKVVGSGSSGKGNGTGIVVLYSNLEGSTEERVCNVPDKGNKVIVFDQSFSIINNPSIEDCLNEFAGAIDYQDADSEPNITSPYVYGTGELNLNDSECVGIRNAQFHEILQGTPLDEFNTNCYEVSNLDELGENCSEKYSEGGSFFDRLDGNYFLGEKYVNQSQEYFNVTKIGLESIIDIYELYYHAIPINQNATWIDYLYWQKVNGTVVEGLCNSYGYQFRLDCQHREKYMGTTTTTTTTSTTSTSTTSTSTTTTSTSTTTSSTTTTSTSTTTTTTTSTTTTSTTTTTTTTTTLCPIAEITYVEATAGEVAVTVENTGCIYNFPVGCTICFSPGGYGCDLYCTNVIEDLAFQYTGEITLGESQIINWTFTPPATPGTYYAITKVWENVSGGEGVNCLDGDSGSFTV